MQAADFITVFGRLLRDGVMRDAFAADARALAAQLNLREQDYEALAQLVPADLEFQANVLLGKRFEVVGRMIPETCRRLGAEAWPVFRAYGRTHWPASEQSATHDAHDFCRHLQQQQPNPNCKAEVNRLRFALSETRFAVHFIARERLGNRATPALQLLFRFRRQRWRETMIYCRL